MVHWETPTATEMVLLSASMATLMVNNSLTLTPTPTGWSMVIVMENGID